jgi:hypothetical protein
VAVCLAAGALSARLAVAAFTLAWTHSIEKVRWEEDWRVEDGRLVVAEARVKGSGAGMEPPQGARLAGGWWRYRPALPPQERVVLARSAAVRDYEVCAPGEPCRPLGALFPGGLAAEAPVALSACG